MTGERAEIFTIMKKKCLHAILIKTVSSEHARDPERISLPDLSRPQRWGWGRGKDDEEVKEEEMRVRRDWKRRKKQEEIGKEEEDVEKAVTFSIFIDLE